MPIRQITIIGTGLIGGSFALAMKKRRGRTSKCLDATLDSLLGTAESAEGAVVSGADRDISQGDVSKALVHLRSHWQRRYGLVEVG